MSSVIGQLPGRITSWNSLQYGLLRQFQDTPPVHKAIANKSWNLLVSMSLGGLKQRSVIIPRDDVDDDAEEGIDIYR